MMKKALIICAAGMSSSLMAKKTTEFFKTKGKEIEVDAVSANEGNKMIEKGDFDLYLVSPQTKMYFQKLKEAGERVGKPVVNIPPQAYIPIPMGVEKLGNLILQELPND
ncbi:cellobiose phosphotransferase system IIB component [Heyndrickxia coagulans]|uniref:Cellobiose phosphotransferase system IIB component n=2 Tax=Bacillaceae TaxID=186817 RepID=A0A133KSP5_HEYCO|nr:cellobiose phosphotransferase system IIB component [Heyndrickxia coagulans]